MPKNRHFLDLLVDQLFKQKPVDPEEGQRFVDLLANVGKGSPPMADWVWDGTFQAIHHQGSRHTYYFFL
jgi:hypothetical protein